MHGCPRMLGGFATTGTRKTPDIFCCSHEITLACPGAHGGLAALIDPSAGHTSAKSCGHVAGWAARVLMSLTAWYSTGCLAPSASLSLAQHPALSRHVPRRYVCETQVAAMAKATTTSVLLQALHNLHSLGYSSLDPHASNVKVSVDKDLCLQLQLHGRFVPTGTGR